MVSSVPVDAQSLSVYVEALGKELKGHSLPSGRDLAATGMESAQAALQLRKDKC